tara:strand:+ start:539 stop:832 length:294 start_codon:yes stop_codon:yes gene_type:complete
MFLKPDLKKVIFTLDIDYLELIEAVDLKHTVRGNDVKVLVLLDSEEMEEYYDKEAYIFASNCLNEELGQSCSDFRIYKPTEKDLKELTDYPDNNDLF